MNKNAAKCAKCGDVIESKSRHDYVNCSCGAIAVDGGGDYIRRVGNAEDFDEGFDMKNFGKEPFRKTEKLIKLKHRITGVVWNLVHMDVRDGSVAVEVSDVSDGMKSTYYYPNLDAMMGEWEDYNEEFEQYFFITSLGDVIEATRTGSPFHARREDFGNYFKTREEAEKAAEKFRMENKK